MIRNLKTDITLQLRKDVLQRRRRGDAALHGEAQAVCLSFAMIRILTEDHGLHLMIRRELQCVEDVIHIRIDMIMRIFISEELSQPLIIVFFEFISEQLIPVIADVYHSYSFFLIILHLIIHEKQRERRITYFLLFNPFCIYATMPKDKGLE